MGEYGRGGCEGRESDDMGFDEVGLVDAGLSESVPPLRIGI